MDYHGGILRDFLQVDGQVDLQKVTNNNNLISFTKKEIEYITHGYSTLLGTGAFGDVYKGELDECPVAVKKYKDGTRKEEFAKEVIVHSQINHKNVVRLLGCCTEKNTLTIVMEFVCNGNLYKILHFGNAYGRFPFPLDKRLDIAIELAEVLSYMHSMCSPVLHGDIKPANILLDENLAPMASDFGIARLLSTNGPQQTENIIGSVGYLDPRFSQTGILTPKSDVYSFGVLLVEMITRKKASDGNTNLIQNFTEYLKRGKKVREMFDDEIVDGKRDLKVLFDIAKLIDKCPRPDDKMRPNMAEVADGLRKNRKELQLRRRGEPSISLWSPGDNFYTSRTLSTSLLNISWAELSEITRSFSNDSLIGKGSRASVFLGELKNGRKFAVQKFDDHASKTEFLSQVQDISRLKHNNIVQLLGHCIEYDASALVYEYSSRGTLHDLLHGKKGAREAQPSPVLSWAQRVEIAVNAAEGLEYLHHTAEPRIIHTKINSSNIIVFYHNVAKIKYGGVPRKPPRHWRSPNMECRSPPPIGYDPPECALDERFSEESDVFSFGVVLLELLTGRKVLTLTRRGGDRVESLVTWARPRLEKEKQQELVDPKLRRKYPPNDVAQMATIANLCLKDDAELRPSMSFDLNKLQLLLPITDKASVA